MAKRENNFRVTLCLNFFYNDHRSMCRIFVSNEMRTVKDLKTRISEIFGIQNYYLKCENCFLPDLEDVGILQPEDIVMAIPNTIPLSQSENIPAGIIPRIDILSPNNREKEKQTKRKISEVADTGVVHNEEPGPSKKKKKKKPSKLNNDENIKAEQTFDEEPCASNQSQKKKLRRTINYFETLKTSHVENDSKCKPSCSLDNGVNIKEKLTTILNKKLDKPVNPFYSSTPKSGDSHGIKKLPFGAPLLSLERKTNIVKNIVNSVTPNDPSLENYNLREEIDKQSADNVNMMEVATCSKSNPLVVVKSPNLDADISKNCNKDNNLIRPENVESARSKSVVSDCRSEICSMASEPATPSDSLVFVDKHDMDTMSMSTEFVTLRQKRVRIRKRKKNSVATEYFTPPRFVPYKPPNIEASPKLHVRFDHANEMNAVKSRDSIISIHSESENSVPRIDSNKNSTLNQSLIEIEQVVSVDRCGAGLDSKSQGIGPQIVPSKQTTELNLTPENKEWTINDKVIRSCPQMRDLRPQVNDFITFKMLVIGESYTPEISNYITGKVVSYDQASGEIQFCIIEGKKEFAEPQGKFSIEDEEHPKTNDGIVTLNWINIVEPRLLYP